MPETYENEGEVSKETLPKTAGEKESIDLSLLEDSLRLTPWQRLVENDRALALVRMFEQAGVRYYGATESNPRTTES